MKGILAIALSLHTVALSASSAKAQVDYTQQVKSVVCSQDNFGVHSRVIDLVTDSQNRMEVTIHRFFTRGENEITKVLAAEFGVLANEIAQIKIIFENEDCYQKIKDRSLTLCRSDFHPKPYGKKLDVEITTVGGKKHAAPLVVEFGIDALVRESGLFEDERRQIPKLMLGRPSTIGPGTIVLGRTEIPHGRMRCSEGIFEDIPNPWWP